MRFKSIDYTKKTMY